MSEHGTLGWHGEGAQSSMSRQVMPSPSVPAGQNPHLPSLQTTPCWHGGSHRISSSTSFFLAAAVHVKGNLNLECTTH